MLRVGLIGAGYLGKIHLSLLSQLKDIELIGLYDTNHENTTQLNQQYSKPTFHNALDLIECCDALIIVTPTTFHYEYASICIERGKSVFIEKPATSTIQEVDQLVQLLQKSPSIVQVGMVERFNPAYTIAYPFLKNIQKIYCNRLAPFTPRGADVSVVFDVMIHDLDIVLSLIDSPIKNIHAQGEKIISSTFDIGTAQVEFEDGTMAHFTASRMAERKYRLTEFIQDKEVIKVDFLDKQVSRYSMKEEVQTSVQETYLARNLNQMDCQNMEVLPTNAIEQELTSFVEAVYSTGNYEPKGLVNNKKVVVSLDDGSRAMKLAQKIEDQMNQV